MSWIECTVIDPIEQNWLKSEEAAIKKILDGMTTVETQGSAGAPGAIMTRTTEEKPVTTKVAVTVTLFTVEYKDATRAVDGGALCCCGRQSDISKDMIAKGYRVDPGSRPTVVQLSVTKTVVVEKVYPVGNDNLPSWVNVPKVLEDVPKVIKDLEKLFPPKGTRPPAKK